jgi:hypothetical protein
MQSTHHTPTSSLFYWLMFILTNFFFPACCLSDSFPLLRVKGYALFFLPGRSFAEHRVERRRSWPKNPRKRWGGLRRQPSGVHAGMPCVCVSNSYNVCMYMHASWSWGLCTCRYAMCMCVKFIQCIYVLYNVYMYMHAPWPWGLCLGAMSRTSHYFSMSAICIECIPRCTWVCHNYIYIYIYIYIYTYIHFEGCVLGTKRRSACALAIAACAYVCKYTYAHWREDCCFIPEHILSYMYT